jgi:hypothetical protein
MDNSLTASLTEIGKLIDEKMRRINELEEANHTQYFRITEQDRQIAALRAELITAHGEAEERMRERDEARSEVERWRVIAAGCGTVAGCTTPESLQCQTQGMSTDYRVHSMEQCIAAAENQIRLQATLARKQRVIDEAKSILLCAHFNYTTIENRADHLTDSAKSALAVLRPESTPPVPASPVGKQPTEPSPVGKASPTIETVAEYLKSGEPGNPSEFPKSSMSNPQRQWSSKRPRTPACYSKWWQAWMNGDRREIIVRDAEMFRVYHNDSDWAECSLWLPWQEGDTKDNLPPLPNAEYMASGEVPGANLSALLAFKSSLSEASAIVAEWPAWKRDILKGVRETLESVPDDARGGAE